MRKILFTTAIISLLFAGCNKDKKPNDGQDPNDPSKEKVKKLPAKMTEVWSSVSYKNGSYEYDHSGERTRFYQYDDINRLVKIIDNGDIFNFDTLEITYNANNNPVEIKEKTHYGYNKTTVRFQYNGNQVLMIERHDDYLDTTTLTINANGQVIKWRDDDEGGYYSYNSNGNCIGISDTDSNPYPYKITFSNVLSVWRHVNVPDWLILYFSSYLAHYNNYGLEGKKGYMLSESEVNDPNVMKSDTYQRYKYTYGLYEDGYVRQIDYEEIFKERSSDEIDKGVYTREESGITTIEYIFAK